MKNLLRVACLGVAVAGVGLGTPAFAAGTTGAATTTTLTTTKPSVPTGRHVTFQAVTVPTTAGGAAPTGSITWTITGSDGSSVSCSRSTPTVTKRGHSACSIDPGVLLAAASPYKVTASYGGDGTYAGSSATFEETVTPSRTALDLTLSAKPTSGAAIVVTARVSSGAASSLLDGSVTFAVASTASAKGTPPFCEGTNPNPHLNNTVPLVDGVATCDLPAGWLVVPPATAGFAHPYAKWEVTASFGGTASFQGFSRSKRGKATH